MSIIIQINSCIYSFISCQIWYRIPIIMIPAKKSFLGKQIRDKSYRSINSSNHIKLQIFMLYLNVYLILLGTTWYHLSKEKRVLNPKDGRILFECRDRTFILRNNFSWKWKRAVPRDAKLIADSMQGNSRKFRNDTRRDISPALRYRMMTTMTGGEYKEHLTKSLCNGRGWITDLANERDDLRGGALAKTRIYSIFFGFFTPDAKTFREIVQLRLHPGLSDRVYARTRTTWASAESLGTSTRSND